MNALRKIGSGFKLFMIVFSFIVNLVLVGVIVVLLLSIFDLKREIAAPLIGGLHSSFVGLDDATIDYTIPVRDSIPVVLDIPLQTDTIVTLNQPVPLSVSAVINLPGVGTLNNAQVNLQLPAGLQLPVRLDLNVPVNQSLDVELDVRAVIPIRETQLHDALQNLQLLFEPLVLGLHNLPDNFEEAGPFVSDLLAGNVNLLAADGLPDPWPGYSTTAGLGYGLVNEPVPPLNVPLQTGLVPPGGMPSADALLREAVYADGGPAVVNDAAREAMIGRGVPAAYFDGSYAEAAASLAAESPLMVDVTLLQPAATPQAELPPPAPPPAEPTPTDADMGILSSSG